ncbi:MAG: 50S ribosomal protein L18 [Acidimicrobiales bacterium]
MTYKSKQSTRERRHGRVRRKVAGTPERPRLSVYRSNRHISAQLVDDEARRTLVSGSSLEAVLRDGAGPRGANIATASEVGRLVGERAVAAGITKVVFDRGGFLYHGRVAALAAAAREAGLEF